MTDKQTTEARIAELEERLAAVEAWILSIQESSEAALSKRPLDQNLGDG